MNIFLTSYGIDTKHNECIYGYNDIINILKNKKVVIIPNARLITQNRNTAYRIQKELTKNNIYSDIIDIDKKKIKLSDYDAIYFTGGEPKYLMNSINKNNLFDKIKIFIDNGGTIIGQSAGAMIFSKNYLDTTTSKLKIQNNGFDYETRIIVPHYDNLPQELLKQLPKNILKINNNDKPIKIN